MLTPGRHSQICQRGPAPQGTCQCHPGRSHPAMRPRRQSHAHCLCAAGHISACLEYTPLELLNAIKVSSRSALDMHLMLSFP